MNGQPVEQMDGAHMPVEQPSFGAQARASAEGIVPPPSQIAPPAEPVVAAAPQPVPAQSEVQTQAEPPPPAVVIPTISADTPPEKPKRGWWRR